MRKGAIQFEDTLWRCQARQCDCPPPTLWVPLITDATSLEDLKNPIWQFLSMAMAGDALAMAAQFPQEMPRWRGWWLMSMHRGPSLPPVVFYDQLLYYYGLLLILWNYKIFTRQTAPKNEIYIQKELNNMSKSISRWYHLRCGSKHALLCTVQKFALSFLQSLALLIFYRGGVFFVQSVLSFFLRKRLCCLSFSEKYWFNIFGTLCGHTCSIKGISSGEEINQWVEPLPYVTFHVLHQCASASWRWVESHAPDL